MVGRLNKTVFLLSGLMSAATLVAANPYDDARYWFRGGSDQNGDGAYANGSAEFTDFVHGATAGHAHHTAAMNDTSMAPAEARRGAVRKNLAAETLADAPYLHFPQTVTTNQMVTIDDVAYPEVTLKANYLNLPNFLADVPLPCTEYTVFIRFRQDGLVSRKQSVNNLLQLGFQWLSGGGSGISVALQGTTVSRYPVVYIGAEQKAFSGANQTAQIGEWNELAVVVRGKTVGLASCVWSPSNNVARIFQYAEQTCGANYNPAILAGKAGVRRIGGEQSGTVTFKDGYNGTEGNLVKSFRGDVQAYAFWSRALTTNELRAVFNECRPNVTWKGLANGHAEECADWNPVLDATNRSVTHVFTNDYFSVGLPQVLRVKAVPGSASARLAVTLDGNALGSKDCAPGRDLRLYVKGSFLAAGVHTLTLTRADGGAESFTVDALTLAGSHRIGTDSGYHGGMQGETYAYQYLDPRICYPEDGNLAHFSRGFSSGNNVVKVLPFDVALEDRADSRFRFHLTQNASAQTFAVSLNGERLNAEPFATSASSVWYEQAIPAEKLRVGENRIEVQKLSGTWVNCSAYEFHLGKRDEGTGILFR